MLTEPPLAAGRLNLDGLAILVGTTPEILQRTLADTDSLLVTVRGNPDLSAAEDDQARLFFQIQQYAQDRGLPVRTLAERHKVSRRTVRRALDAPPAPPEELIRRRVPVIDPIKHLIDALLEEGISRSDIWDRLVDEHDIALGWTAHFYYARSWQLKRDREPAKPLPYYPSRLSSFDPSSSPGGMNASAPSASST
jgi:hypothetical protein